MKTDMIVNLVHSNEREVELQELCSQVLSASPNKYYNPNGADETTCPFCHAIDYSPGCWVDIDDLPHTLNCAYIIAKGLSTNIR